MDKKDLIYIVVILILSFLLVREFNKDITIQKQDEQQEIFLDTLPKMGQDD